MSKREGDRRLSAGVVAGIYLAMTTSALADAFGIS
jgi:hypothetical protein